MSYQREQILRGWVLTHLVCVSKFTVKHWELLITKRFWCISETRIAEHNLHRVATCSRAVFCPPLCADTAYLYRTPMRTIILLIKPISFEPCHSMLVLAITIGNIKSHPSQRTVHLTNTEKPETWVSPCYTYSKEQWPYLPHPYPADVN